MIAPRPRRDPADEEPARGDVRPTDVASADTQRLDAQSSGGGPTTEELRALDRALREPTPARIAVPRGPTPEALDDLDRLLREPIAPEKIGREPFRPRAKPSADDLYRADLAAEETEPPRSFRVDPRGAPPPVRRAPPVASTPRTEVSPVQPRTAVYGQHSTEPHVTLADADPEQQRMRAAEVAALAQGAADRMFAAYGVDVRAERGALSTVATPHAQPPASHGSTASTVRTASTVASASAAAKASTVGAASGIAGAPVVAATRDADAARTHGAAVARPSMRRRGRRSVLRWSLAYLGALAVGAGVGFMTSMRTPAPSAPPAVEAAPPRQPVVEAPQPPPPRDPASRHAPSTGRSAAASRAGSRAGSPSRPTAGEVSKGTPSAKASRTRDAGAPASHERPSSVKSAPKSSAPSSPTRAAPSPTSPAKPTPPATNGISSAAPAPPASVLPAPVPPTPLPPTPVPPTSVPSTSGPPTSSASSPSIGTIAGTPSATDHPLSHASTTAAPPSIDPSAARGAEAARDKAHIDALLSRYERGYGALDVNEVAAVWPTVNRSALARAFDGLQSQRLKLDRCRVSVEGAGATAACQGSLRVVRRVGSAAPLEEALQWTFQLERAGPDWVIRSMRSSR